MADPSNYSVAQRILNEQRTLDTPERALAAAQVAAQLAFVDEMFALRHEVQRLANSVEELRADLPKQLYETGESLRQVVRTVAGL